MTKRISGCLVIKKNGEGEHVATCILSVDSVPETLRRIAEKEGQPVQVIRSYPFSRLENSEQAEALSALMRAFPPDDDAHPNVWGAIKELILDGFEAGIKYSKRVKTSS